MNTCEYVIWYIGVYHGSEKRVINNVVEHISYLYRKESEAINAVENAISWLIKNGYIAVVPYSEMNDDQKSYHLSDNYCRILKVIKKYDELEYIKKVW